MMFAQVPFAPSSMPSVELNRAEVLKCSMADAIANIPPKVLAAALQDVEGVVCDLSTAEGERKAIEIATRLMQSSETLEPLLVALEKHGGTNFSAALPATYGPVAMEADALPSDSTWNMPPIGSTEFDTFMTEQAQSPIAQQDLVEVSKPSPPSLLGFIEYSAEPVSITAFKKFDSIFLDAQRQLKLRAKKTHKVGFWSRIFTAAFTEDSSAKPPLRFATKMVENYTVVEARQGSYTKLNLQSIASGTVLFVLVRIDGKVIMKDRITLSDPDRAVQRFTEVFAEDAEAGAEALHELRDANASLLFSSGNLVAS